MVIAIIKHFIIEKAINSGKGALIRLLVHIAAFTDYAYLRAEIRVISFSI